MESNLSTENVFEDVALKENGQQLVLQQTQSDQAADILERVDSLEGRISLSWAVEIRFSWLIEKRRIAISLAVF